MRTAERISRDGRTGAGWTSVTSLPRDLTAGVLAHEPVVAVTESVTKIGERLGLGVVVLEIKVACQARGSGYEPFALRGFRSAKQMPDRRAPITETYRCVLRLADAISVVVEPDQTDAAKPQSWRSRQCRHSEKPSAPPRSTQVSDLHSRYEQHGDENRNHKKSEAPTDFRRGAYVSRRRIDPD